MQAIKRNSRTNSEFISSRHRKNTNRRNSQQRSSGIKEGSAKTTTFECARLPVLDFTLNSTSHLAIHCNHNQQQYLEIARLLSHILSSQPLFSEKRWHPETSLHEFITFHIQYILKQHPHVYFELDTSNKTPRLSSSVCYAAQEFSGRSPECHTLSTLNSKHPTLYHLFINLFSILHYLKGFDLWYDDEEWAISWLQEQIFDAEGHGFTASTIMEMKRDITHYQTSAFHHYSLIMATTPSIAYFKMLLRQYHPRIALFKETKQFLIDLIPLLESSHSLSHFLDYFPDDDDLREEGLLEPPRYFRFLWSTNDHIHSEMTDYYDSTANGIGVFDLVYESEIIHPTDFEGDFNPEWPYQILQLMDMSQELFQRIETYYK